MKSVVIGLLLITGLAFADNYPANMSQQRLNTCNSWKYSFEAKGYVCNFTSSVSVYEAHDIDALVSRIEALEQRIAELEASK